MIPALRGGRHEPTARHLLVPAVAAAGARRTRSRDRTATPSVAAARDGRASSSQLTGEPVGGGTDADRAVDARRRSSYGPGDVVGIDAARDRPHRAARLDHQLRAELPAVVEFYDEDFPWRYTPAAPTRPARGCGRGSRWSCSTEERVRATARNVAGPAAAVHRRSTDLARASRRPTSCGRGRTCTSTAASPARDGEFVATDMAAVLPRLAAALRREPRPRLLAARLPAPAGAEHRATTRSSCRPSRPAGSPGSGSTRRGAPYATASAWDAYAGRPEAADASPSTTAGTSAPATRGRLRVPRAAAEPQPVDARVGAPRHGRAGPGAEPARASTTRRSAACCGSAARCGCRRAA